MFDLTLKSRFILANFLLTTIQIHCNEICNTQTCISVADQIAEMMDPTADPCEDFYQFSCGGYIEKANSTNSYGSQLVDALKQMEERIERLMKAKKPRDTDFETDQKVKDFYNACEEFGKQMRNTSNNETIMQKIIGDEFKKTLANIGLNAWPYSKNTSGLDDFRWHDVVPKIIREGLSFTDGRIELPIINVDVGVNDYTKSENVIKINSPDHDRYRLFKNFAKTEIKYDFDYYMEVHYSSPEAIMKIIDPTIDVSIQTVLNRSMEIHQGLRTIANDHNQMIRVLKHFQDYGLHDFDSIETTISKLPPLSCGTTSSVCTPPTWEEYLKSLFGAFGNNEVEFDGNQTLILKDPKYVEQLETKLKSLQIHPYEMKNYLGWKVLVDYIVAAKNFQSAFKGNCLQYLLGGRDRNLYTQSGLLNVAVGSMYVREYFDPKKKEDVTKMVQNIRKTFKLLIPHLDWMDEQTKTIAKEKFEAMDQFIAYPDELMQNSTVDQYYKDLNVSRDHLTNLKNIGKFLTKKTLAKIGKKWKSDLWTNSFIQNVKFYNAFYAPWSNEFVIPAGFLNKFNFDSDQPMYLNYGVTGSTIGHEMMHGFDISGINFNKDGKYGSPGDPGWWSKETYAEYNKRAKCISDHYSSLVVEELSTESKKVSVDGEQTLRENIADIAGNRLSYYAYQWWAYLNGEEPLLPGLTDYNQRQLFWIRHAHFFCAHHDEDMFEQHVMNSTHTQNKYRILGSMMLSDEFAKDFNCSSSTNMNPKKECPVGSLWPRSPLSPLRRMFPMITK